VTLRRPRRSAEGNDVQGSRAEIRGLLQELYLLDLVLPLYGVYTRRLRDAEGARMIGTYLGAERERRSRIERSLAARGIPVPRLARRLFAATGGLYGRLTSLLGTRFMLRIALSGSRRAARRACALLAEPSSPELLHLSTLRARNEGELLDELRQHLIDTAARRG
jgi:hypothetical protein